jgi:hypothetical protein
MHNSGARRGENAESCFTIVIARRISAEAIQAGPLEDFWIASLRSQ